MTVAVPYSARVTGTQRSNRAVVFAPPPPPPGGVPGGISAITAVLTRELGHRGDVYFQAPVGKERSGTFGVRRGLINIMRLVRATVLVHRGDTVLVFSSAGFSFWEKCLWSVVVRVMGRAVAVVMVDGNFPHFFESLAAPLQSLARQVFSGAQFTIGVQSPAWQQYFRQTFPRARVERVSASVDREFFESRPANESNGEALRVLYVGWIIEAKGVCDLLDAIVIVAAESPRPFHVRLVGPLLGGDDRWHHELEQRHLGALVTLAGTIHHRAELVREYQTADIFVFPSHAEGFPVALVEAVAVGLPCIGSRVGGIPDILDEGRAGLIVPACAPVQLAAALRHLLENDAARVALGDAAKRHAQQEYTHEECASTYLRLLGIRTGPIELAGANSP